MSDAAEIITTTQAGRTFRASRRTAAHIEWTIERLSVDYPGARFVLMQPCFNTGVSASAGTHDYDAVIDLAIEGLSWSAGQDWMRAHGWAAWWRYPPLFGNHIHAVSLGYPGQVGVYVPGQVRDYYAHRTGLAGHLIDPTWHPADINSTVFDYAAWEAEVTPDETRAIVRDEIAAATDDIAAAVTKRLLSTDLAPKDEDNDTTVRGALNAAAAIKRLLKSKS